METYLWLILFPIVWPFIAKRIWPRQINWTEMFLSIIGVCVIISVIWFADTYSTTADTEIWNGQIVSKSRDHGHYLRSYECNCSTDSKGNRRCSTCYKDRYTVNWSAVSTVGDITFDHLDSGSSSVYLTPDPYAYTKCYVGEPASLEHHYVNYIRAVPESLFHGVLSKEFTNLIPSYPRVHDYYHVDRVINVGSKVPSAFIGDLDNRLDMMLRNVGPSKEVNIIVVFVNSSDPNYRYSLEQSWVGGKKNDVVIIFGVVDDKTISWVDVMTWAKNFNNELFHVMIRDSLKDVKTFDSEKISAIITKNVVEKYSRPSMKSFEYLKDSIQPPEWIIILCVILSFGGSLVTSWFFYVNEIDDFVGEICNDIFFKVKNLFR